MNVMKNEPSFRWANGFIRRTGRGTADAVPGVSLRERRHQQKISKYPEIREIKTYIYAGGQIMVKTRISITRPAGIACPDMAPQAPNDDPGTPWA